MNKQATAKLSRDGIELHGEADFIAMRKAGKLAAETLYMLTEHVVPGVTTEELDRLAHLFITKNGAIPAPLNYKGFPKSICTSKNHIICHGIPDETVLKDGDIIITLASDGRWKRLCRALDADDIFDDPRYATSVDRAACIADVRAAIQA